MNKIYIITILLAALFIGQSCNDHLDIAPPSEIIPEKYLWDESHLDAYALKRYQAIPVSREAAHFGEDNATDLQAGMGAPSRYVTGEYKVELTGGAWDFSEIYHLNYFISTVMPRYHEGKITGSDEMVRHYIGEIYFLRALAYFQKLSALGDFPILKTTLSDDKEILIQASKRMPRNEVARFIIADLDSAIVMMKPNAPDKGRNRLSQPVAQLLKSRVALNEGTWLKYFANTPFAPKGEGWPGASKDYNKDYQFSTGSIEAESNWFLEQAMDAADKVASTVGLVDNTGVLPQGPEDSNPFVEMYGAIDMSKYEEVLLWRAYDKGLGITNNIAVNSSTSNFGIGITKGMVNSYLMENGLPYYAAGSKYKGDESIGAVREGRDHRAMLFLKEPNQLNMWINTNMGTHGAIKEPFLPNITSGSQQFRYNTGYTSRKGVNPDKSMCNNWEAYGGIIVYRAAEAYLNYIEASYERNGSLDSKARNYWAALRERAHVSTDIQATINATNMAIESQYNWSAYSGGKLVDPTLYNIRRERASELVGEGFRNRDLKRWRSMDQLMTNKFHIEGIKVWGNHYKAEYEEAGKTDKTYKLVYGIDNKEANVSSPQLSTYLRPYQVSKTLAYDGYTWHMAHYLDPIAVQHFKITSSTEGYGDSPVYQNPYWPLTAGSAAEK